MIEIRQTPEYEKWFESLKDRTARARVAIRIRRLSLGNSGTAESAGEGISELKIDHGPGYRIYYAQQGSRYLLLLVGGDKATQSSDIKKAKALARKYSE